MLFIRKIMCCQVSGCARSQHCTLEHKPKCTLSHLVRSSTLNCSEFLWRKQENDGLGLRRKHGCTWSVLDHDFWALRSIAVLVRSSTLTRTTSSFCLVIPFQPHFHAKDLQHTKTLKLTQTLENNKAKSLTNIS
jgi:hypothetical protein